MKRSISKSLIIGAIYTLLFAFLGTLEDASRSNLYSTIRLDKLLLGLSFYFVITSAVAFCVCIAFKYHSQLKNKGWQRLLIVAYTLLMPVSLFILYEVEYVSKAYEHVLMISIALTCSYIIVIGIFFLLSHIIGWIKNGFTEAK
jgi:hypothetical protein